MDKRRFNNYYKYLKNNGDFERLPLKKLLEKVYQQACIDCGAGEGKDISNEEVEKFLETQMFLDFVQDCIVHPTDAVKLPQNDFVLVHQECTPEDRAKCVAFPDRCIDVGCVAEGGGCDVLLNLSKLCGIESDKNETIDDKLLTEDEVKELARALENANN